MHQSSILKTALQAAKEAEKVILQYYSRTIHVDTKSDQTPVTIADKKAEEVIKSVISDAFPDHGFLGEEKGIDKPDAEYIWIIDPIDGTKNYIRQIPLFGTQIALMHKDKFILGVTNMPLLQEIAYAEKGKGTFINGRRARVSEVTQVEDAFISYGNIKYFMKNYKENLLSLILSSYNSRGFGDCWMYNLLANGRTDVVLEAKTAIWDIAASIPIIEEAGGRVSDINGNSMNSKSTSFAATNGILHHEVIVKMNQKN